MKRHYGFLLAAIAILTTVATACGAPGGQSAAVINADVPVGEKAGMRAPDFTLTEVTSGEQVSLSQFRGQPVLLNFWATWCGPCRREMPELQQAYEQHQDDGFTVIAIDSKIDDGPEAVLSFVNELGLTFPVVKDTTGVVETNMFNVIGYPTSIFVDRDGIIRYVHRGPLTKDLIDEKLSEIL